MGITIEKAERLKKLPPYLFVEIDKAKRKALSEGKDIIDLGVGDPDQPTPRFIIDALHKASLDSSNHHYALDAGMPHLRQAIAKWYKKRFGVILEPDTEILPLIGSKEGIAHLPLAIINPGDEVLIPDPCYPPYKSGTIFAGGVPYLMPLLEENDFLPDLDKIDPQDLNRVKLMFLNYPNNPTGAVADEKFFKNVVRLAAKHNIIVAHDCAYSEVAYNGFKPMSFLEVEGAKEAGVEFHSLSKTFNMTGWRIGFACGNSKIIELLAKVKSNIDSGIFQAIQLAGIAALQSNGKFLDKLNKIYQERRDILVDGFNSLGWKVNKPKATFYVWVPVPSGYISAELCQMLLEKAHIVATPGTGFGENGEGYIRLALTVPVSRVKQAISRIKKLHKK